jgi:hypothetical protein
MYIRPRLQLSSPKINPKRTALSARHLLILFKTAIDELRQAEKVASEVGISEKAQELKHQE